MDLIIKICIMAVGAVIIISIIKTYKPEFTVEAVLCTSILLLIAILSLFKIGLIYFENIYGTLTYGKEYFPVILKVLAISYITEFAASLCEDAGEKSIASKVELAGKVAVFVAAVPVFTSVIKLLTDLL